MGLTGKQLEELHGALLDAFPSSQSLEQFLQFRLDARLADVARVDHPGRECADGHVERVRVGLHDRQLGDGDVDRRR